MSKIMDNGEIRDMTPEEQAQFDADQSAPKIEEQAEGVKELMTQLDELQNKLNALRGGDTT